MATNFERIATGPNFRGYPLFNSTQTRAIEAAAAAQLPVHTLMQRAGLAIAQFAMAIAPHAKTIWIPCGPGNNGGDGVEAARHLKRWGKTPVVTILPTSRPPPSDALAAQQAARLEGLIWTYEAPDHFDLCIDALFGIGNLRAWDALCHEWILRMNSHTAPVLAVDLPSGLHADTGCAHPSCVQADFTLSLLSLKPGLFTADGRDVTGEVWLHTLGLDSHSTPCAHLNAPPPLIPRTHNSHKGNYGDVGVVGGDSGMVGAALLAASAALHGGAGRVYLGLLGADLLPVDQVQPEIMARPVAGMDFAAMTVIAGCGGGLGINQHLPRLLATASRLVLDADALNSIAQDSALHGQLLQRPAGTTVLTPHPLEAARLIGTSTSQVQSDRLACAQALASHFACTVVLKGSGTIVASPGALPRINPTGNARLASAGTGDVLAGLIGAYLATGADCFIATCNAVFRHGAVADTWSNASPLTASTLARSL